MDSKTHTCTAPEANRRELTFSGRGRRLTIAVLTGCIPHVFLGLHNEAGLLLSMDAPLSACGAVRTGHDYFFLRIGAARIQLTVDEYERLSAEFWAFSRPTTICLNPS